MNQNVNGNFGQNLKFLRKQKGLTQQTMAEMINTSRSCISNYESGSREPDNETLKNLADYFDVSVDFLFGRSEIRKTVKSDKDLRSLEDAIDRAENTSFLHVESSPAYIKCAVVKFYTYLLSREKKKN